MPTQCSWQQRADGPALEWSPSSFLLMSFNLMSLLFTPLLICYTVPGNQMDSNQHNLNIKIPWKHHLTFNFYIPPENWPSAWNRIVAKEISTCFPLSPLHFLPHPPNELLESNLMRLFKGLLDRDKKLSHMGRLYKMHMCQRVAYAHCYSKF